MARKTKGVKKQEPRRVSVSVRIEGKLSEHMILRMLKEMPETFDEFRCESDDGEISHILALVHDHHDESGIPIGQYQYLQTSHGGEIGVREVHIADSQRLTDLGYKSQS